MKTFKQHEKYVRGIARQMRRISENPKSKRINFTHGSTYSTRTEENEDYAFVDISGLNNVLEVNTKEKYALAEPNIPLDKLLKTTLENNLIPQVIAEFPGITVGGAVNGASLESSSFKYGQFNDTAEEYEIVLANGDIVRASRDKNSDLFYGSSGSYGTLGLLTLVKLRLAPAKKYVRLTYEPTDSHQKCLDLLRNHCNDQTIDYSEAVLFSSRKGITISGTLTNENNGLPIRTYSRPTDPWFYLRAKEAISKNRLSEEAVPIADYIFRYNRGAFWMGEYTFDIFHLPHYRTLRWLFNPVMKTRDLYKVLHATNFSQKYFIQDFYVPFENATEFIRRSGEELNIYPLWLCPMKPTQTPQKLSPHYLSTNLIIDVGIWGQSKKYLEDTIGLNKKFEQHIKDVKGRKMLYAHTYYSRKEFWKIYDHKWYQGLRRKYHAQKSFPEIWEKIHVASHCFQTHLLKGLVKFFWGKIKESLIK